MVKVVMEELWEYLNLILFVELAFVYIDFKFSSVPVHG